MRMIALFAAALGALCLCLCAAYLIPFCRILFYLIRHSGEH